MISYRGYNSLFAGHLGSVLQPLVGDPEHPRGVQPCRAPQTTLCQIPWRMQLSNTPRNFTFSFITAFIYLEVMKTRHVLKSLKGGSLAA